MLRKAGVGLYRGSQEISFYNLYGTDINNRGPIPFSFSWPGPAQITQTYEVPSQLSYASALNTSNARFNVAAGSYSAFAPRANHQVWNFASGATISGFNCSHSPIYNHIEVTGGVFEAASSNFIILDDLLFKNAIINSTTNANSLGISAFAENPTRFVQRNAFIHCTFEAYATGLITTAKSPTYPTGHHDIIFAACYVKGGKYDAPSPSEAGLRLMGIDRAIVVDCRLASGTTTLSPSTYKNTLRSHYGCTDYWARNNLSEYGDGVFINSTGGSGDDMPMGHHYIYDFQHYKGADNSNVAGANIFRDYDAAYWINGSLTVVGSRAYDHRQTNESGANSRFFLNQVAGDNVSDNLEFPYQDPPTLSSWLAADGLPPGANQ